MSTFRASVSAGGVPAAARGVHEEATTATVCSSTCYSTYTAYLAEITPVLPTCIADQQSAEAIQAQLIPYV